ncbi:unnamed protein product [Rotaria sordida]|uniref:Uncharacterized protein n=1 Tax=Rotaria sordida TaxID=392033 RepID=A0A815HYZ4_9BILA|nr:unnamed protein product [Rotaria sordida]CAF1379568.1 unnamed protein product [Rotaria sordida]CAF3903966.1 unnamed protein product [Rotaria sordida]CAF3995146.1 unnamed protein product [Rotaria sordida]
MRLLTRILFTIIFILMFYPTIIETAQCSCSCCLGNSCKPESLPSLHIDSCSLCKSTCNTVYPSKCGRNPGVTISACSSGLSIAAIIGIVVGIIGIIVIIIIIVRFCTRRSNYLQR